MRRRRSRLSPPPSVSSAAPQACHLADVFFCSFFLQRLCHFKVPRPARSADPGGSRRRQAVFVGGAGSFALIVSLRLPWRSEQRRDIRVSVAVRRAHVVSGRASSMFSRDALVSPDGFASCTRVEAEIFSSLAFETCIRAYLHSNPFKAPQWPTKEDKP
jgi:hypothetical protein